MQLVSIVRGFIKLLLLLDERLEQARTKRARDDHEREVEAIRRDPVAYARSKFGGVRQSGDDCKPVSGDPSCNDREGGA